MSKTRSIVVLPLLSVCFAVVMCAEFVPEGGTLPAPVKYFKHPEEQTQPQITPRDGQIEGSPSDRNQEPRLGYPISYGNDLQGYSGGVSGVYSPLKIDLGGLVLGTIIGLGAVLIVPKILHIFSPPTHAYSPSGYKRSLTNDDPMSSITKMLSRVDETLSENHIDSKECLQRAVCTYIQSASSPAINFLNMTASNPLVNFLVDGSKFKAAIIQGQSGDSCSIAYPHCPFSKQSLTAGLQGLISNNSI